VKRWILSLALVALPGFCEDGTVTPSNIEISLSSPRTLSPAIALYTHFDQAPAPDVEDALHEELAAIMYPMGLRFEWRSLEHRGPNEVAVELAVINFKGRCGSSGLPDGADPGIALGWTHVSDGVILPFSDVDCNRIRTFVGKELAHRPTEERDLVLGRAMARVLAHELYHIFANTARHGNGGVGKSAYSVQELMSDRFTFDDKESNALLDGKRKLAMESGGL
jgi:hypothetical protein